jgi:hypothetical protein
VKAAHSHKHSRTEDLLVSLAESVGSTLGTIAAKAGAAQKALTHSDIASRLGREGNEIVRKTKKRVSGAKRSRNKTSRRSAKRSVSRTANKVARKARATVRRTGIKVKGTAARAITKGRRAAGTQTRSRR